ncbi:MAG TPA: class I SAM-dependent methyltransferase [Gemmatimonadaceae bacterium]|nr:class I SAM-dependent methyltransferase [Gemmatimonadaceae bacterium]
MNTREATALIAAAVEGRGGTWADVGAGDGTFTRALAELLGPGSRIYAVDNDARAMRRLEQWAARAKASVMSVVADFTGPFELPSFGERLLDGMLAANALHFVRDPAGVLARLVERVRPGGRVVVIEYDRRRASRWVPYPIDSDRLPEIAAHAGLTAPTFTATRPSLYGGAIYVGAMDRLGSRDAPVSRMPLAQKPTDKRPEQEVG